MRLSLFIYLLGSLFTWSQDTTPPETITDFQATFHVDATYDYVDFYAFQFNWTIPFDDSEIVSYRVYNYDNQFHEFSCTGCNEGYADLFPINTDFCLKITSIDEFGNESLMSNEVCLNSNIYYYEPELFISQYYQGSGDNKAIELSVNRFNLDETIDLSEYDLRINLNSGNSWSAPLNLSGTLVENSNYNNSLVIINSNASESVLTEDADLLSNSMVLQFDGNDPIGLFKNDELIDILGDFNNGGTFFIENGNYYRDACFSFGPSTETQTAIYNEFDWSLYYNGSIEVNETNVLYLGSHGFCTLLSNNSFVLANILVEPNPITNGYINIHNSNNSQIETVSIFNINGQQVYNNTQDFQNSFKLVLPNLSKGVYFLKLDSKNQSITKKIIVN